MNFTNGFHGVTLGALAATGNIGKRQGAHVPLSNTVSMPYDGYLPTQESLKLVESYIKDGGTGVELPAAIIFETVQGEGGLTRQVWSGLKASLISLKNMMFC